jgi:hypothetical protein
MAITANYTEPGKIYRLTRSAFPGHYYTRPIGRKITPEAFVARLEARRQSSAYYWAAVLRQHPDAVLMRRFDRYLSMDGSGKEIARLVLLPSETVLREVKKRPNFKSKTL